MSDALLAALRVRSGGRRRVPTDAIWRAFDDAFPVDAARPDARARLRQRLDELAGTGAARLPKSRRLWDRSAAPPLPRWVELTRPTSKDADEADVAWAPELAFAREVRNPRQRAWLRDVQRFLAAGGRQRPRVPARERSLEVFGDEKRLERLAKTRLFGPRRLTHDLLRCFPVSPPMVFATAPGRAQQALIVENHHTYHSFRRWNEATGTYAFVAYGAGKAAERSIGSLREFDGIGDLGALAYFGDLDATGIAIAVRVAEAAKRRGLPPIVPATRWYRLLLQRRPTIRPIPDETRGIVNDELLGWFPESIRGSIADLVADGQRLPQELVGWEQLSELVA